MSLVANPANLLQRFSTDGYVAIPGFMTGNELAELNTQIDRFIETVLPKMSQTEVFYEDKDDRDTLKQIQHMGDHDAWFHNLITKGRFRQIAELLLGGPVVPKNMQYFNKPPGIGQPTPPHQDGYYFMLAPCEAVTMWFALDDVDQENGCVRYVRGSHLKGMRNHARTETLGFSQGIDDFPTEQDLENEIAFPAQPGDLLVHHAMTIHRAGGNRSIHRTRKALGLIYYSQCAREDVVAHEAYQRKLAQELKTKGAI
jgi:phytanoyl-CoA hydroxylase